MVFLKRNGLLLLWFIPSLIAFASALILIAQQRPPFRMTVPIQQTAVKTVDIPDRGPMRLATFKGEAEFGNAYPAMLTIQVRDRLIGSEPDFKVEIFRDGQHFDSMMGKDENTRILSAGNHTYRLVAETNQLTRSYPQSVTEMTVLLEYPSNPSRWQGLCLLGMVFSMIGTFQWTRTRGRKVK